MQPLPSNISLKSSHIYTFLDYKQAKDTCVITQIHLIVNLMCYMEYNPLYSKYNLILHWLSPLLLWFFIIPHTLLTPGRTPPPVRSGPVPLSLWCVDTLIPPAADGRQERGDTTGMSFEMVRSSVYRAAQMKVSREEMHKAEGEVGVAAGGIYRRGREDKKGLVSAANTSPTLLLLLPGRIYFLSVYLLLLISLSLSPPW